MKEAPFFSRSFNQQLETDGFMINDIVADIRASKKPSKLLREITNYNNEALKNAKFNPDLEETLPKIKTAIESYLKPWMIKDITDLMPQNLSLKQLSRTTKLNPRKIESLISRYGLTINLNGSSMEVTIVKGNTNPKKIQRLGRYQSRPPGGGPVQRARIQSERLKTAQNRLAQENQIVVFQAKQNTKTPTTRENAIPRPVTETINWFKQQRSKKWLRGTDEQTLARNLADFSQGKPTDFVLWNCFEFEWLHNPNPSEKPLCIVTNKLNTSIVLYFQERIKDMATKLSWLGKPNFTVLIPSSEATYGDVWNYLQSPGERQQMINSSVTELNAALTTQLVTEGIKIEAMRWDDYLTSRGVSKTPDDYSLEGDKLIRQLPNFSKIQQEAITNEISYFRQRGIEINPELVAENGIKYYGAYCGEGMGLLDIKQTGRNIIMINLEEFRVAEMTALGSNNQIPIVTPVSHLEMMNYYGYQNAN